jgi:hypothetical protein
LCDLVCKRLFIPVALAALTITPAAVEARAVCGPTAKTLATSAEARVYVTGGIVRSCHRARTGSYRLGARVRVIDVQDRVAHCDAPPAGVSAGLMSVRDLGSDYHRCRLDA